MRLCGLPTSALIRFIMSLTSSSDTWTSWETRFCTMREKAIEAVT